MEELIILQTHIDYITSQASMENNLPTIVIFGKTINGIPIQVKVNDFLPYFYIETSHPVNPNELEDAIKSTTIKNNCHGVDKVLKKNIYGYVEDTSIYYKVFFNTPTIFRQAKAIFDKGLVISGQVVKFKTFESNFPFVLRFMHDINLAGCSYIKIKVWEPENTENGLIIKTSHKLIEVLPFEGKYNSIIPLKILSFDIECCGDTNAFPSALLDPVVQIGNIIQSTIGNEIKQVIFCLKEVADIPDAVVHWFDKEEDLLMAWNKFIHDENPDIILGYNIKNFDFPYLLERANILKLKEFARLGRTNKISKSIKKTQSSSQFGSLEFNDITIEGRIIFDIFHVLKRDFKLRSYSLNSVSMHFLKEQKEAVSYSSIHSLQNGNKETRRRIATYCLKDAYLPLRIFKKLNIFTKYIELARVTYVPIEFFLTRGTSIKVLSLIYKEANAYNYIIPDMEIKDGDTKYDGAFVINPLKGFYKDPIAVLDFCSLYPSIIISNNLCYTTLLSDKMAARFKELDIIKTPTGDCFVSSHIKKGLLPIILEKLLSNRKLTKKLLKETEDPELQKILDGRQLALKLCANSIYGFTGAQVGQLPCISISQSTTAFGRDMISKTKNLIESKYSKASGFTHDVIVIYGDTDSVMLNFQEPNIELVFKLAKEIAEVITAIFIKPVALEFEKVYCPYLLMNKKRYAGLLFTNPYKSDKIDTKGIETVRRDNCELVKIIIDNCLNKILYEKDIQGAIDLIKMKIDELYNDKIDISQLVISKAYTKSNYNVKSAHTELVNKLRERGVEIRVGDRIPYVIICGDKKTQIYNRSEDPIYVLENNIPIDIEYYIEHQLSNPIKRLFEPIMDNVEDLFKVRTISGDKELTGPMTKFIQKLDQCIGCQKVGTIICDSCKANFFIHLSRIQAEYNMKFTQFHECWTECQRCMNSVMNKIICINRDCPIFYIRTKIKNDLNSIQKKMIKVYSLQW